MIKRFVFLLSFLTTTINAQNQSFEKGLQFYKQKNYSQAIKMLEEAPLKEQAYPYLAESYFALGLNDKAITYYKKAIEIEAESLQYKLKLADILEQSEAYEAMKQLYTELLQTDSLNANFHYKLGLSKMYLNDSIANKSLLKSIALDSMHLKALTQLSKYYIDKGLWDEAIKYANKGLALNENNKVLINYKANALYFLKNYRESAVWFEKLLELNENKPFIYRRLKNVYAYYYQYEDALKNAKKLLQLEPDSPYNYYQVGELYKQNEQFDSAEVYVSKALKLLDEPLDEEYRTLGTIYNRQEKYPEAIKAFQRAIEENPSNPMLYFYLANSKSKYYKDIDSKIKAYELILEKFPETGLEPIVNKMIQKLREEKFSEGTLQADQ